MVAARKQRFQFPAFDLKRILNFPVPAWQFGVSLACVLCAIILTGGGGIFNKTQTIIIHKTDTVFDKGPHRTLLLTIDSQAEMTYPASGNHLYYADSSDRNLHKIDKALNSIQPGIHQPKDLIKGNK